MTAHPQSRVIPGRLLASALSVISVSDQGRRGEMSPAAGTVLSGRTRFTQKAQCIKNRPRRRTGPETEEREVIETYKRPSNSIALSGAGSCVIGDCHLPPVCLGN